MKHFELNSWKIWILLFLISLSIRLLALPATAIFTADEEYQATYAQTIVKDFHPIWIGVSAGDTGFYLGPYFTYLTAFLLFLGKNDPLITNYFGAVLGSFTTILIYLLGTRLKNYQVGLMAALLYTFSPFAVYLDQRYWNPNPAPFLTILFLISLAYLKEQKWSLIIVAFCLGAFWHVHLSLIPLSIIGLIVVWKDHKFFTKPVWVSAWLVFLLMVIPLLIFDYYHDWSNILTPLRMIQGPHRELSIFSNIQVLIDALSRSLYLNPGSNNSDVIRSICPNTFAPTFPNYLQLLTLIPIIAYFYTRQFRVSQVGKIIFYAAVALLISFIFYPGEVFGYYAVGLIPIYFLLIADLISELRWRHILLLLFCAASLRTLISTDAKYGLQHKRILVEKVSSYIGSNNFSLQEVGTCHRYGGWRYLFTAYGKTPSTSSADESLAWLYPNDVGGDTQFVVIVSPTEESLPPESSLAIFHSGGYTAYITGTLK